MSSRFRRTVHRITGVGTFARTAVGVAIAYLPAILDLLGYLQAVQSASTSMLPWFKLVWVFLLSPYFAPGVLFVTCGWIVWRAWPVSSSSRQEFFIEMIENQIELAQTLLKRSADISLIEWKTWEEKTVLDMAQYLTLGSRHIALFRLAGELATYEYESGGEGIRSAISRQIRTLQELIDRIDQGVLQRELRATTDQ